MFITKKELLELTNISYAQLYRWKREGLIPEDWFIKRSSHTGQETFFIKDKILGRIQTIQKLKKRYTLTELNEILSPKIPEKLFTVEDLNRIEEIDKGLIACFVKTFAKERFTFIELLIFIALSNCKAQHSLQLYDIMMLCLELKENAADFKSLNYIMILLHQENEYYLLTCSENSEIYVDSRFNKLCAVSLNELSFMIHYKYFNMLNH